MRITVNLSSRPFTNHRLLWIGLAAVFLVSLYLLLSVSGQKSHVITAASQRQQQATIIQNELDRIRQEIEKRKLDFKPVSLKPEEAYQLAAARRLINLKAFSWNRLLGDIEGYVPNNARITSIKVVEVFSDEQGLAAVVEINALGKSSNELTEMMSRLDKSAGLFSLGESGQEQATEEGDVPFSVSVIYRPRRGEAQ
jgi:Tfp pilus assembly protein PilN